MRKYSGYLVRVNDVKKIEPNGKEYSSKLAKAGLIERVGWGRYRVPCELKDPWNFEKDVGLIRGCW